jgi:hypothetical protein
MVLSVSALAQYPASPNTGAATTPYATNVFSATFNGPVEVQEASRNAANTSTDYTYESNNGRVLQVVTVRVIDHAIAVDYTSSDFYVNDMTGCNSKTDVSRGTWDNRPYTYVFCTTTSGAYTVTIRVRYIIVNSTTVLMIKQGALESDNDRDQWLDFEYSLRIK